MTPIERELITLAMEQARLNGQSTTIILKDGTRVYVFLKADSVNVEVN